MAELVGLAEGIAELVRDGDTIALEGFTHLIPVAAGQEIIRQGRRDLTLIRMTPDIVYDQLIGAGCARKLIFSWGGNPGVGSLHRFRDAIENAWPVPTRPTHTATPSATTRTTSNGTPSAGTASGSARGCAVTSWRHRQGECRRDQRRDDDRRGRTCVARRRGLLRRHRQAQHGRQP